MEGCLDYKHPDFLMEFFKAQRKQREEMGHTYSPVDIVGMIAVINRHEGTNITYNQPKKTPDNHGNSFFWSDVATGR